MDNSWLFENEEKEEEEEAESDEEDKQTELEERLYAVVHHNDLSQPLPSELAKHYSIQCADNGELEVTLNNSLEVVKSTDSELICNLLKTSVSNDLVDNNNAAVSANKDDDDDVIIVSSSYDIKKTNDLKPNDKTVVQNRNSRKRFRYSDLTLEEFQGKSLDELQGKTPEKLQRETLDQLQVKTLDVLQRKTFNEFQGKVPNVQSTTNDINYFDHSSKMFFNRKHRKYKNLKVPPSPSLCDWKNDSNLNFIDVGPYIKQGNDIIHSMIKALIHLNPGENIDKLAAFARILYKRNVELFRTKRRKERKKARKLDQSIITDSSFNSSFDFSKEMKDLSVKIQEYNSETMTYKRKREDNFDGSISLNISPFKPNPKVVDLSSDIEDTSVVDIEDSTASNSSTWKENSSLTSRVKNSHFPTKWTKEMVEYYSKRRNKPMKDIDKLIANLKKGSGGKDWYLDPRDKSGNYQRPYLTLHRSWRCSNCNERGHLEQTCDRPVKLPACTLCGELYHTDYSCPNKVCLKCGMFIMSDTFGGECNDCYFATFCGEKPCSICREVTHKSSNCTDLWRSFHATTGGEKKIPDNVVENKRKSCCNCSRKGHFSHDCPFIAYSGQQISSFVKNYSAEPLQRGSVDVIISKNYADIINSDEADRFFHDLSDYTQAVIGVNDMGYEIVCKVDGTFEQCKKVKMEIENYVNTRKRKRQEPKSKRKRQRVRY